MGKVKFTVECEMEEQWVDDFCSFLSNMESNGFNRYSEIVGFYSDGYRDFRPKFKVDRDYTLKSAKRYDFLTQFSRPIIKLYGKARRK